MRSERSPLPTSDFRVEAITPIRDRGARRKLKGIIDALLLDQRDAWRLNPDGSYTQLSPDEGADPDSPAALGAFEHFMRTTLAEQRAALTEG